MTDFYAKTTGMFEDEIPCSECGKLEGAKDEGTGLCWNCFSPMPEVDQSEFTFEEKG